MIDFLEYILLDWVRTMVVEDKSLIVGVYEKVLF